MNELNINNQREIRTIPSKESTFIELKLEQFIIYAIPYIILLFLLVTILSFTIHGIESLNQVFYETNFTRYINFKNGSNTSEHF